MTDQQLPSRVDVAVVGAGSAGAATAAFCAERGLSTLCIDRAPLADAGAHWVNGVPGWAFDDAGLARPVADELRGSRTVHLVIGYGPNHVVVDDHGVLEVDMGKLTARLHSLARDHGAQLLGECAVRGLSADGLRTDRGDVTARWVVDASGLAGARLLGQPQVKPGEICVAAQEVHRLLDEDGAREFFAAHQVPYGQAICFMGVVGGFSVVQYRCEGDYVSMLVGSVPADGHPPGKQVLDDLVAEHAWIGARVFGGARAIPIRRPFDRIANQRVAAIGDAAAQVFSAHGSGVGHHLVAARLLADELAAERGPQSYGVEWQRRHGGLLASYDLFRRFTQRLPFADLERMADGLMTPALSRAAIANQLPEIDLATAATLARGIARQPRLGLRVVEMGARMLAVRALYARYPRQPEQLPKWSRRVARLFGDEPDVVN